jgi:carbon-monoxide dehydrogenase iron sulfur subunit
MRNSILFSDPEKCLGCSICEFVCSATKEKSTDPLLSRIRVVNLEPVGSISFACVQCNDTPCVMVCPRKALRQNEVSGVIEVNEEKCNGCGWCIEACPFGAIAFNPETKTAMICDLCGGDPECVKYCPFDALTFSSIEEVTHGKRKEVFENLLKELAGKEA